MTTGQTNILERGNRLRKLLAVSATALVMGAVAAAPSWAAVNNPHTVTAFPDRDFIGAEGYRSGESMQIKVLRNGVVIGDTGPASAMSIPGGFGLEVNHGVEGTTSPGDCWVGTTPDIQGGDVVQVITKDAQGNDVVESMTVADIGFAADQPTTNANGDVVAQGFARDADGGPLQLADLAAEVLHVDRDAADTNADPVRYRPDPSAFDFLAGTATWQATWASADHTARQMQRIADGGFSMAHAGGAAGNEVTISELGEPGGPAAGCDAPAARTAIGGLSATVINENNVTQPLVVSGVAAADITDVNIALNGKNYTARPTNGTWQVSIPAEDLAALPQPTPNQAAHDLVASFTSNQNTAPANQTRVIQKDTVDPGLATATPDATKRYNHNLAVTLGSPEGGATVHYTRDGSTPTLASPVYNGQELNLTTSQTIKAAVEDAAGNFGQVATFDYVIDRLAPGAPSTNLATASYDVAQRMTLASTADDLKEIRYTTDGSTPTVSHGTVYNANQPIQIPVGTTRTVKAVVVDTANNVSGLLQRTITVRKATATNVNVATANLKLGNSRTIGVGVSPNQAGGLVQVRIDRPGTLSTITRNVTLDAFSRSSFAYRPTAVGYYRITATFLKDADALGSTSTAKTFRVIR